MSHANVILVAAISGRQPRRRTAAARPNRPHRHGPARPTSIRGHTTCRQLVGKISSRHAAETIGLVSTVEGSR